MPQAITDFESRCVPLSRHHVDTDQIIPARFLKGTEKAGMKAHLFYDLRYDDAGNPKPDFVLNQPQYEGARILVAGDNFGCGSSREHAPWALVDHGFQAVIAISFADIFKNNALKNGLLPIALPESVVTALLNQVVAAPETVVAVSLTEQQVNIPGQSPQPFEIDAFRKSCLLQGVDEVGYTLGYLPQIEAYEKARA